MKGSRMAKSVLGMAVGFGLVLGSVGTAQAVSKDQVMKDFKSSFTVPEGRKLVSMSYVGKPRKFQKVIGLVPVDFTAYEVEFVFEFSCGTKVKYTNEVWYRNNKDFSDIASLDIQTLSTPPAPAPLTEKDIQDVVSAAWPKNSKILSLRPGTQKASWNFCDTKWEFDNVITVDEGDPGAAEHTKYECRMAQSIWKKEDKLSLADNGCYDLAGTKMGGSGCDSATQCKNLGTISNSPAVEWNADVQKAIKERLCNGFTYDSAKDCKIVSLELLSAGKPEVKPNLGDAPARKFTIKYEATFDENTTAGGGWHRVNSKYRCKAEIEMMARYSGNSWGYDTTSLDLCPPGKKDCRGSWNSSSMGESCDCLEPSEIAAQCARNRGDATAASAVPKAPAAPSASAKASTPSMPNVKSLKIW